MEEGRVDDLRRRLLSAGSALLGVGVERVQTDVPSAGGRLQSKRDASIVQPTRAGDIGSVGLRGIVVVTSVWVACSS